MLGSVFNACENLETFVSKNVKEIWYAEFAGDSSLKNVTLENVKYINREAFTGCTSLKSISLPSTTQFVNSTAFPKEVAIDCANKNLVKYGVNGLEYAEYISVSGQRDYDAAYQVLNIVNKNRAAKGLNSLVMDTALLEDAMFRAAEGHVLFSHTRPDSSICFTLDSKMHAENIAAGQNSANAVMKSWMNSEGHKENILNKNAKSIGVGCFINNGSICWIQVFSNNDAEKADVMTNKKTVTEKIMIRKDTFEEAPADSGIAFNFGGSDQKYKFKSSLSLNTMNTQALGNVISKASFFINNPGFSVIKTKLNPACVTWKSSDDTIATIDDDGEITGLREGIVTIKGSIKYFSASKTLSVGNKKIKKIKISAISHNIAAGKKIRLKATISPKDAAKKKLKWTTSNAKVATVNQNGIVKIKAKTGGKSVTIKATATDGSKKSAIWKIKSMKGVVKKVTVKGKKKVKAGKTLKLKAKVKATKGANKKLKWTSSNTKWATVSGSGKVKTKKAGKGKKVKITAQATDGSGKKKTVTIKIK